MKGSGRQAKESTIGGASKSGSRLDDERAPDRPNIVLLVADDLGWGAVGYHDSPIQTPNLDQLAADGVRLERFYVCPICSPTRAGLLTGRWPIRYGIMATQVKREHEVGLDPEEDTLAEMLGRAGYSRRGLVGKWHLGDTPECHPLNQGFTSFYGSLGGMIDYRKHKTTRTSSSFLDWYRDHKLSRDGGHATTLVAQEATKFIREHEEEDPFFLMVPFHAPHVPLMPEPEDLKKYRHLPEDEQKYAAMVDGLDQAIGEVLAALDESGVRDNTFVLFLSDNGGPEPWNRPLRGRKRQTHEGGIRVPAIVHWPDGGLDGGRVVEELVGYIDVYPTLQRIAGVAGKPDRPLDGIDALAAMRGDTPMPERDWFSFVDAKGSSPGERFQMLSVTRGSWKLTFRGLGEGEISLYRIDEDPQETLSLAERQRAISSAMLERVTEFRRLELAPGH